MTDEAKAPSRRAIEAKTLESVTAAPFTPRVERAPEFDFYGFSTT